MNINYVFECAIYEVVDKTIVGQPFNRRNSGIDFECVLNRSNYTKYKIVFIKKTLVYYDAMYSSLGFDLDTGEYYKINNISSICY